MKDKETKEFGKEWQDEQIEKMVRIQFPKTIQRIEQEAERRGYERHREEVVDRIKCLPSKKKCRPTVKNGRRNWLSIRYSPREILLKLLEEENER